MKNRSPILNKLDSIDSNLNKLSSFLSRNDRESVSITLETLREQLDQVRLYIESEPLSSYDLNK